MKILSIDTASNICGVSILEDNNLLINLDLNTGTTHSENLMPMIENAFSKANLHMKDIDLIVCDKGPGSFTGIRIGIATCKAFSDSLSIQTLGISSLESLAYNVKESGLIASLIDCKNNNCYYSLYELKDSTYKQILEPESNSISNILTLLKNYKDTTITFVGDASVIHRNTITSTLDNNIKFCNDNKLNSYSLALAGINKFSLGITDNLLPLYLKKPQAQRQLEERLLKNEN